MVINSQYFCVRGVTYLLEAEAVTGGVQIEVSKSPHCHTPSITNTLWAMATAGRVQLEASDSPFFYAHVVTHPL